MRIEFEDEYEEVKDRSFDPVQFADWIIYLGFVAIALILWYLSDPQNPNPIQ